MTSVPLRCRLGFHRMIKASTNHPKYTTGGLNFVCVRCPAEVFIPPPPSRDSGGERAE